MNTDTNTDTPEQKPRAWVIQCVISSLAAEANGTWGIRRHNRSSGKSRWGSPLFGMGEYFAKTLCNDANAGKSCFRYQVVSPKGEIMELKEVAQPASQPSVMGSCDGNCER